MSRGQLLVVDDKPSMVSLWRKILEPDHDVTSAADGAEAISLLRVREFDVVVTDLRMPGADGFAVLEQTLRQSPQTQVLLVTAYATVDQAVEAMRQGAFDFLTKPFDPDHARLRVERALERRRLQSHTQDLENALSVHRSFGDMVGLSPTTRKVFTLLERAAASEVTVLLQGESGTGKELAARALHINGARRSQRFVPVNCGALPSELIESELFGHVKGAFSGAHADKPGLFEVAGGGTLFLDEVSELPLSVQVKLNRALQEREVRRVGETQDRRVDVRVIAASNVDLRERIRQGAFREDLFYRLHVLTVWIPPLRERREDIPLLASTLLTRLQKGVVPVRLEPEVLNALTGYGWPGNVRELENVLLRALAVGNGNVISLDCLPEELIQAKKAGHPEPGYKWHGLRYKEALQQAQHEAARAYLEALMRTHDGSVTRASEAAGMARETLHRQLKRHGLDAALFRKPPDGTSA